MKLVIIAAFIAVCGAAKLDRTYLPPPSANTAGGSSDSLQTPLTKSSSSQGESTADLPNGSYTNNFQGVVVDAAAAGIRASPDADQSGLGGPRDTYGSTHSKVGDAAFRGSVAGFRNTQTFGNSAFNQGATNNAGQNLGSSESKPERPQAHKDRNSNIISYANDVSSDNYSYGFETDNGIAVGENGVANNGIQAQGGYSYKGDDGQVYKVTYVADEGGYRPQGAHLPTPPPIPKEILESLEQNAKEEAAGLVDDGSYDAHKYNAEGDYIHHNGGNIQYNAAQLSQFSKRPESDASASSTSINQNNQAFRKPGQSSNLLPTFNGQSNQFSGNKHGSNLANNQYGNTESQNKPVSEYQHNSPSSFHNAGNFGQHADGQSLSQFGQTQTTVGSQSSQFGTQSQHVPNSHFGSQFNQQALASQDSPQSSQFGSQTNTQGLTSQFEGQSSQFETQSNQFESGSQLGNIPAKPSYEQNPSSSLNDQSSQGTQLQNPTFKPQNSLGSPSQAQNNLNKPQYNENIQGHSQVSQTQLNTQGTSFSNFGPNKSFVLGQGQVSNTASTIGNNGNRFSNTPNQFGAEYLPPLNPNNKLSFKKPQTNEAFTPQKSNTNNETPEFIPLQGQNQNFVQSFSASASASVGPTISKPQSAEPLNTFEAHFSKPNQFNYNSEPNFQNNGVQALPLLGTGLKPTTLPDTELTTPLEPQEKPISSQIPQLNSQSSSSSSNLAPQSVNNQIQQQNSFQNIAVPQQPKDQILASSFPDARPQGTTQFLSPSQTAFSTTQNTYSSEGKPQFSQISFAESQQNNGYYSTLKPSFSQGPDDSYYYNQPSKPFGIPAARPEGSRFPSSPSYQSIGVTSSNQQNSVPSFNKFPSTSSLAPVAPFSVSENAQSQGSVSTNYYNGITQASISPFPLASPTPSSQYNSTLLTQFKPSVDQPSIAQAQLNKPTFSQQQSAVSSYPSKPSFTQNQIQFVQASLNNEQQQSLEKTKEQQPTSTITQQYQGTIYEYNKPPEVLPAPEQTNTSPSQSVQTGSSLDASKPQEGQVLNAQDSKPQFNSQQSQSQAQSSLSSQSQEHIFNQHSKDQFGSQSYKPFENLPNTQKQVNQNFQSTLTQNGFPQNFHSSQNNNNNPSIKTNASSTSQFNYNTQGGSGSRPSFVSQSTQPFGGSSYSSQIGQSGMKPLTPFSGAQPTKTQFGQNTHANLGSQASQLNSGSQFSVHSSKPFGSITSHASGASAPHNLQTSQVNKKPFKPLGIAGPTQGSQSNKPFGNSENTQGFPGYPISKLQFGTQLTPAQFSQSSQQNYGANQISSQPARAPLTSVPPTDGSLEFQKPQIEQNLQENKPSESAFGQQPFQSMQFSSTASKPQFGTQTQFGQNQNSSLIKPLSSASSQAHYHQNSAQVSSSAVNIQQPQSTQAYKPFGTATQGSNFQNTNQYDQASQSSHDANIQSQFNAQSFKPFISSATQGSQNKPQTPLKNPYGNQQGSPCCQSSKDSSIIPLNVGKPSQAFAQTQSQFAGFQGAQGHNSQSVAGKGEEFGGPRKPPSFDTQTGYHY